MLLAYLMQGISLRLAGLVLALIAGCAASADGDSAESELIHGGDDRHGVHAHPDARLRELAARSAMSA